VSDISIQGLTPPSLSNLPSLTWVDMICPFWTPGRENRFQGSKSSRFARSGRDGDSRFQGSKWNRFTGSGHGEKADSRVRNRNYAADGISNLAHRPTTLFPTSSSSRRIFVGEVGDPRASQSVSQAGSPSFFCLQALSRAKKKRKRVGLIITIENREKERRRVWFVRDFATLVSRKSALSRGRFSKRAGWQRRPREREQIQRCFTSGPLIIPNLIPYLSVFRSWLRSDPFPAHVASGRAYCVSAASRT
jgi:hypothetical protein